MILSETARPIANIWHVRSPSRRLLSWFKLWHWGQKWPHPVVTCLYIPLNREHIKIFLTNIIRLNVLIFDT